MAPDRALARFEAASRVLQPGVTWAGGSVAKEAEYASAYQGLVRAGLAPQIKKKYRRGAT